MPLPAPSSALGLFRMLRPDGSLEEDAKLAYSERELLAMHHAMRRIRRLDERLMRLQRQGRIGFYGAITGQEATPVAAAFATRPSDWIFPALRESSILLTRGFPLERWLAQLFGNEADLLKGRQMPSHPSSREQNVVSWSSCLGPQLPQAVGAAMAATRRGDSMVSVGFIGEGATSEGDFHAAMNMAAVFEAPTVFVCQNNGWAISVPASGQTASETFAIKAHAYGMPGVRVDGNDVIALCVVLSEAIERAREGGGPTLVEAVTYRIGAHSSSDDPSLYRSEAEVEEWRARDPLLRLERLLLSRGLLDEAGKRQLESALDAAFDAALKRVEPLPSPPRRSLFEDVYAERPRHLTDQLHELTSSPPGKSSTSS